MSVQMIITLAVFLFMIISFSMNKLPMALTSIVGMLVLVVTGCVDSKTALGNMGSNTVITMISMFVIAAGLSRTQMGQVFVRAVLLRIGCQDADAG